MDEDKLQQIIAFTQLRYEAGYRKGYQAAVDELLNRLQAASPPEPKPKRARRPETRPRLRNPVETLGVPVLDAIASLAVAHPEGVEPETIAQHLQPAGYPVDTRQIRLVLRQLTLSSAVLRVARGRYLPTAHPAPIAAE